MKRVCIPVFVLMFAASAVFAANFAPTVLTITGLNTVQYDFGGQDIPIPVTVSGTPANVVFSVFTKDKANTIEKVTNGYLGWHYVNQIDTCIYVAPAKSLDKGVGQIIWNGKDEAGNAVAPDIYTYYLWGYDNVNSKVAVTRQISYGWNETSIVVTMDEQGNPLPNPIIYTGGKSTSTPATPVVRIHQKWIIGNDPDNAGMVETTSVMAQADNAAIALLPTDHTMWFKVSQRTENIMQLAKYKWVPNGASELQTDWGDNGLFTFNITEHIPELHTGLATIPGKDHAFVINANFFSDSGISQLIYVSLEDGVEEKRVDLSSWWVNPEDGEAGGQLCGGPSDIMNANEGRLYLNFHGSCLQHVIDPYRDGDIDDMTVWANQNGDYVADHNFEATSPRKWVCNDFNVAPYIYNAAIDAHGFSIFPAFDLGAVSFGLIAPDGTGIGYFAYANETAGHKWGEHVVDYNSPFDGYYTDNASASQDTGGWWFVGHDSFKGVIGKIVGVADEAPSAFSVAQNTPNPFNPTTTINFTLAKAGKTTVEVFNAAGQKVDTILNANLSAGSHSVTWNAATFSAGVYFYTVKNGDFSKTMKMTLLK